MQGADQLHGNCAADKRLCFHFIHVVSTISLLSFIRNFKPLVIFCNCVARLVSDLVRNLEDKFSHDTAHLSILMRKPVFCTRWDTNRPVREARWPSGRASD